MQARASIAGFFLALLALLALPADSFAQVDGKYVGSFYCYQTPKQLAELSLESRRGGKRLVGVLTIYDVQDGNKAVETVDLKGKLYDAERFFLELGKHHSGGNQELLNRSLKGTLSEDQLKAQTTNWGCALSMAREGSQHAVSVLRNLKRQQRLDYLRSLPPERKPRHTKMHGGNRRFRYVDAVLEETWESVEIEPVDSVSEWLNSSNLKCLKTEKVRWQGNKGSAVVRQFGKKWNVVDCRGDCGTMSYGISGFNGMVTHWGLEKPVPVVELKNESFAPRDMVWTFTYEGSELKPPEVRVHQWSNAAGDSGPGCNLFP